MWMILIEGVVLDYEVLRSSPVCVADGLLELNDESEDFEPTKSLVPV